MGVALLLPACTRESKPGPSARSAAPQVLRLSQRNEPADLDPAKVTLPDEFGILRALCEGLLLPAPGGGEPRPGAAARYDVSPDGITYTFHLRPGALWSNGDPVTSADFVRSYQRVLTPATAAQKAAVFYPVRNAQGFLEGKTRDFTTVGFRAVDQHTLVITLERPNPRFPHYVASGPWLPVHLPTVERHGRKWTEPANFVGNGPFVLAEWRPQQRIVVKKNPRWHGAAAVRLAEIQFVRFDSNEAEERAYRAGQVDATMAVPISKLEVYARERPAELHRAPLIETRYLAFNTTRGPLQDERVRRALALALDRQKIAERVLQGGQEPAIRFVPSALRAAREARSPGGQHQFDPSIARRLLAAAGYDGKTLPRLELTGWTNSPLLEAMQAMWRQELGIDIRIALREAKVHQRALAAGDYDIGFITAIPDVADAADLLGDFTSSSAENYPQWRDPVFDDTYRRAALLADAGERATVLVDAEQQLLQRAPVTPLYFNTKIWLMSPRVRGWEEDGLWTRTYQTLHLE
ncbi:MAG: peptide ABC transporter substrate-binding protein [Opitutaceae bacterium]|nr:peptide ABC transporter substrate-binding protein [Opitutaceae bacterium]